MAYFLQENIFTILCFSIVLGTAKIIIPDKFSGITNILIEIMLFVVLVSSFKSALKNISFDAFVDQSFKQAAPYEDLKESFIEKEAAEFISDKLKNKGILPDDIRIDINIDNGEIKIEECNLYIREDQKDIFNKQKESIEKELGIFFSVKGVKDESTR